MVIYVKKGFRRYLVAASEGLLPFGTVVESLLERSPEYKGKLYAKIGSKRYRLLDYGLEIKKERAKAHPPNQTNQSH